MYINTFPGCFNPEVFVNCLQVEECCERWLLSYVLCMSMSMPISESVMEVHTHILYIYRTLYIIRTYVHLFIRNIFLWFIIILCVYIYYHTLSVIFYIILYNYLYIYIYKHI